jgi:hypothetical protein
MVLVLVLVVLVVVVMMVLAAVGLSVFGMLLANESHTAVSRSLAECRTASQCVGGRFNCFHSRVLTSLVAADENPYTSLAVVLTSCGSFGSGTSSGLMAIWRWRIRYGILR